MAMLIKNLYTYKNKGDQHVTEKTGYTNIA